MMKKYKSFAFILFSFAALMISFQNCGQVKISSLPSEPPPSATAANASLLAEGCVNSIKVEPEKTKFIFVVDLSRSNIGDFYKGKYLFGGSYYDGYYFFNTGLGTDQTGLRFDAISNFISTCGSSANADYAVIGFSNTAGALVKTGAYNTLECHNEFMNSSAALGQLNAMKQVQFDEQQYYSKFKEPDVPYLNKDSAEMNTKLYKETNYVAATDCISSTIEADMSLDSSDTSNYQVFFISDGEALATDTGCESANVTDKVGCYTNKMNVKLSYLMKLSSAKSKPVRIHAMYYTASGAQDLKIESYMKYLSDIGQTNSPTNLGSLQSSANGDNPFCKLLAVDKSIVYRSNKIFAVNTSIVKVGKYYKKDSDQDGIPDEQESGYGSDPNNARSIASGVLDGICKMIGTKTQCQQARSQITCDPNRINQFNMSDCDIKILHLDKAASQPELAGIDTDGDGIPDYIEIIRGTDPINNDSYLDYDSDGLTNMQEISQGLDPFTPDAGEPSVVTASSNFVDQIEGCTSGGWQLSINALSGNTGDNALMLYFRTESKNTQGLQEYRVVKTGYNLNKSNDQNWIVSLYNNYIRMTDFSVVSN